jgi:hypothetical protein
VLQRISPAGILGTAIELEAHQTRGGTLLLEHPDGTLQELTIDLSHDGTRIPTSIVVTRAARGRGRLWTREGRR